jgi:hypothetical protein
MSSANSAPTAATACSLPRRSSAGGACGPGARVCALGVAALCLAPLVIAARIAPAPAGHGTHERLGLPACGWAAASDAPCPTCGMTTAFAHAVRGNLLESLAAQPLGFLGALAAAAGFWMALHVALTGSNLAPLAGRLLSPKVLWGIAGVAAVSWAYKWVTWSGMG